MTNYRELLYDGVRVFFRSILSIFFSQIDIVGIDNIPRHGPIIFSGNHSNQFVDGVMVMTTCQHRVGFMIAQSSYDKPLIGGLAKLAGAVPVQRAMDKAIKCPGTISISGNTVTGHGPTLFSTGFAKGDKIRLTTPQGQLNIYKVASIISDTCLLLSEATSPEKEVSSTSPLPYEKLPHVDQSRVFNAVFDYLRHGKSIGIFPEGGSHDRTDLIPLQPGIAFIAFGMLDQYNITVPIVPVGLNYFKPDRFRSRVVVEFGPPIR